MFFMAPVNDRWAEREAKVQSIGSTRQDIAIGCAVVCVGILVAVQCSLMVLLIDAIASRRHALLQYARDSHGLLVAWLVNTACMGVLGLVAFGCVQLGGQYARGSGMPQLLAYLNGCKLRGFTGKRVIGAKFVATSMGLAGGFFMGPEGPIIHMGACIGKQVIQSTQSNPPIAPCTLHPAPCTHGKQV